MDYKQVVGSRGTVLDDVILRVSDGAFIPADLRNRDWVEYQKWLSLGNTPDPA